VKNTRPSVPEAHPVGGSLEAKIKRLQEFYWSDADPDGRGFVALADAYRREGDSSEALRILRDGLRRHPEISSGHVVRGWIYASQGDASEAEAAFRAALEVDGENVAALRGLGDLLARQGEASEASGILRRLMSLDPTDDDLPRRVEELEAVTAATGVEEAPQEGLEASAGIWEDPDGVAEELNWNAAALQADQSRVPEPTEATGSPEGEGGALLKEAPPVGGGTGEDALVTRTMGDIFLRQGLLDEAEDVFRRLLGKDPEDRGLLGRLEEVAARRRGEDHSLPMQPEGIGEGAPTGPVPIQELLADPVVAIAELAPDLVMAIEDLRPDVVVPIETLAPEPSGGSPLNPTLDAFEDWLDKLQ
jgi:tetratricopeptide (TPR) repeat protein